MATPDAKMVQSTNAFEDVLDVSATEQPAPSTEIIERKLIRNGTLEFQTEEVKKTRSEIEKICKELNAYISSESENNYGERLQYNQLIRVPANQFDALVARLEPLAQKIENKNISTEDVTEQFIDVEARLKTKKELEARYREILKQAKTVDEIVSIENQISNVRSEIESMEGRLNFLKNQVAFSTLNVTYYETIGTDFGFATKFVQSLKGGWDNLLAFIIFLVNLWPFVLGLAVLLFWFWKRRIKRK
jgi:primosomal protein N''